MTVWLEAHEPAVRVAAFASVFVTMALWELAANRRELGAPRGARWLNNLGLTALNTILLRLLFPVAATGAAAATAHHGWGLFNVVELPGWLTIVAAVVLLDLAVYLQHVTFHAVPLLWRLHEVHHADEDFDVTTGARFHPIEMVLSMGIKMAAVVLLGAPAVAVVAFEVLLSATATFNHANVRVPRGVDRWLRLAVVTPDMHRVHHSVERKEHDSNFGFALPWWDRAFGTYRAQPQMGHEAMRIGLGDRSARSLGRMLVLPFLRPKPPATRPPIDASQRAPEIDA